MTPKEKAKELVDKFYEILPYWVNEQDAKQCALIAVDEMIKATVPLTSTYYWQQVKTEIEIL